MKSTYSFLIILIFCLLILPKQGIARNGDSTDTAGGKRLMDSSKYSPRLLKFFEQVSHKLDLLSSKDEDVGLVEGGLDGWILYDDYWKEKTEQERIRRKRYKLKSMTIRRDTIYRNKVKTGAVLLVESYDTSGNIVDTLWRESKPDDNHLIRIAQNHDVDGTIFLSVDSLFYDKHGRKIKEIFRDTLGRYSSDMVAIMGSSFNTLENEFLYFYDANDNEIECNYFDLKNGAKKIFERKSYNFGII
ncbi:MAG TPA: hypothetical protein VKS81_06185 [Bacteroidota bacterium]|nr:hypothetical protein [Bacteroidota bacterium]